MEPSQPEKEPANLRFLRILVTVLTATMIVGLLTMIGLFVMRLPGTSPSPLPDVITLPDGTKPEAFTQSTHWYAVVTDTDEIMIFDRSSGTLRQRIKIAP